jgi:hypothetical protein
MVPRPGLNGRPMAINKRFGAVYEGFNLLVRTCKNCFKSIIKNDTMHCNTDIRFTQERNSLRHDKYF